jgi:acyl-CoA oxidase
MRVLDSTQGPLKAVLEEIVQLYALKKLEDDLAWFICEGILSPTVASAVPDKVRELCARVSRDWETVIAAFDIPQSIARAPIAGDWAGYNAVDNQGEVLRAPF